MARRLALGIAFHFVLTTTAFAAAPNDDPFIGALVDVVLEDGDAGKDAPPRPISRERLLNAESLAHEVGARRPIHKELGAHARCV